MGLFVSISGACLSPVSELDSTDHQSELRNPNVSRSIFRDFKTILQRIK